MLVERGEDPSCMKWHIWHPIGGIGIVTGGRWICICFGWVAREILTAAGELHGLHKARVGVTWLQFFLVWCIGSFGVLGMVFVSLLCSMTACMWYYVAPDLLGTMWKMKVHNISCICAAFHIKFVGLFMSLG